MSVCVCVFTGPLNTHRTQTKHATCQSSCWNIQQTHTQKHKNNHPPVNAVACGIRECRRSASACRRSCSWRLLRRCSNTHIHTHAHERCTLALPSGCVTLRSARASASKITHHVRHAPATTAERCTRSTRTRAHRFVAFLLPVPRCKYVRAGRPACASV